MSSPARALPPDKELNLLRLLCTYLLYERAQETEVRVALEALVIERHSEFHNGELTYQDCGNEICSSACAILEKAQSTELQVNTFAISLMESYAINFQPVGDGRGGLEYIRAKLIKKETTLQ